MQKRECSSLQTEKGLHFFQTSRASFSAKRSPISDLFVGADAPRREEYACVDRSPIERILTQQSSKEGQKCSVLRRFLFVLCRLGSDRILTWEEGARGRCGGFLQVSWESVRWGPRKRVPKFVWKAWVLRICTRCYDNGVLVCFTQRAQNGAETAQNDGEGTGK